MIIEFDRSLEKEIQISIDGKEYLEEILIMEQH